jgi:alkylhydroperoxidase/carboxymuconolactone decarboxylase family protein YurZ
MSMQQTKKLRQEQSDGHWNLMRFRSDTYDAQQVLEKTAFSEGELSVKTKRLLAIGIAIQSGSEAIAQQQLSLAADEGATFKEAVEAIEVGIAMGGAPAAAAARTAFHTLDELYPREILAL